jgi:hypothetical protein
VRPGQPLDLIATLRAHTFNYMARCLCAGALGIFFFNQIAYIGESKMYKNTEGILFHVFTDSKDDFTKTEKEADEIIAKWKKEMKIVY